MMVDINPIVKISKQYLILLERYENKSMSMDDYRKLLFEIKLFWLEHSKAVSYFLNSIDAEDEVAFLAGANRLDIKNNGHFKFILAGKIRIINDPFLKFSILYSGNSDEIDYTFFDAYMADCLLDTIAVLRNYAGDFFVLPIEGIEKRITEDFNSVLIESSEQMVLSMVECYYVDKRHFYDDNPSFEIIESRLITFVNQFLIYSGIADRGLSLRERVNNYLLNNGSKIKLFSRLSEAEQFFAITQQFCIQAISIAIVSLEYSLIPFIRNDVVFQYYSLVLNTNMFEERKSNKDVLKETVLFIISRKNGLFFDDYLEFKESYGNGKLVEEVIQRVPEDDIPDPKDLLDTVNQVLKGKCI